MIDNLINSALEGKRHGTETVATEKQLRICQSCSKHILCNCTTLPHTQVAQQPGSDHAMVYLLDFSSRQSTLLGCPALPVFSTDTPPSPGDSGWLDTSFCDDSALELLKQSPVHWSSWCTASRGQGVGVTQTHMRLRSPEEGTLFKGVSKSQSVRE